MGTSTVSKDKRSKAAKSALALALALLLALGGTFAWTSVSQLALNEEEGTPNPGARLHDSFAGIGNGDAYGAESTDAFANKDIFVENYSGSATVFARVKLYEYLKIGSKSIGKDGADPDDYKTWASLYSEADRDATEAIAEYWTLNQGGGNSVNTYYMPTFNKSNVSLAADVRGEGASTPDDAATGKVTTDTTYYTQEQMRPGGAHATVSAKEWTAVGGTSTQGDTDATHSATTLTTNTSVVSIKGWNGQADTWVYDPSDGYVYWSSPLAAGETTGLLLDSVQMTSRTPSDAWAYRIQAVGQFVTEEEWGMKDGAPLFSTSKPEADAAMSADAYALLNRIAGKTTYSIELKPANEAEQVPQGTKLASIANVTATSGGSTSESTAAVKYELAGSASPTSATTIDPDTGIITVASDEPEGTTLKVTATVEEQPSAKATYTVDVIAPDWKVALGNALTANESYARYGNSGASLVSIDGIEYNKLAVDDADKSALVLARELVKSWGDANNYHGAFGTSNTWDGSNAETWCNGDYYNSLGADVKAAVKPVTIYTQESYNSGDVVPTTEKDKAFFLSQADVYESYADGAVNYDTSNPKFYTYGNKSLVPEDIRKTLAERTTNDDGTPYQHRSFWYLRSPCTDIKSLASVGGGNTWNGDFGSSGAGSPAGCARPAFWLNLNPAAPDPSA